MRPGSPDRLPLIGPVPGWPGVYLVAGHFRGGMLLSAISTRWIADLRDSLKLNCPKLHAILRTDQILLAIRDT